MKRNWTQRQNLIYLIEAKKGILLHREKIRSQLEEQIKTQKEIEAINKKKEDIREDQKMANEIFNENEQEKTFVETKLTCLIDTCSVKVNNFLTVIDKFSKLAITNQVIEELEKLKRETTDDSVRSNIRKLFKKCALDKDSTQIEVLDIESTDSYVDNILFDFLMNNKEKYCLLTSDYILASRCKGKKIEYYLTEEFREKDGIDYTKVSTLSQNLSYISDSKLYFNVKYGNPNIATVAFDKNMKFKSKDNSSSVELVIGDIVYILTFKRVDKAIAIAKYQVINISSEKNVEYIQSFKVRTIDEIKKLNLNSDLEEVAIQYMQEVRSSFDFD